MSPTTTLPDPHPIFVAANRAAVYGTVTRWLLHQLRNPAQAIGLVAELLPEDPAGAPADLWTSLRGAIRGLTGATELLDRALRLPPPAAEIGPVALSDIFSFIAAVQETQKSAVDLDIGSALAAGVPAVAGREDHLEHVFLNLVVNALEALGDREAGTIRIGAAVRERAVEITVEDDGPGVPPELRGRLFEPFVTTKAGHPTAGFGLPVARHLVEQCGGTLTYVPAPTPGATFLIRLNPWP